MENLTVLSLFDGISCAKVALEKTGFTINHYFASEVDKYAIQIASKNHPDIIHLGDIKNIKSSDLPPVDLIIGGSPCQGFSFAGKQLNFSDSRSKLFFEFVRLVKECQPKYFLLENVIMKQEYQNIISHYLGVNPIQINSSLVSAQNRKRLYWTDIPNISQPKDKKIYLKNIVESKVNDLLTQGYKFNYPKLVATLGNRGQGERIYSAHGKSITLKANGWGTGNGIYAIAQRGRYLVDNQRKDVKGASTNQRLETSYSEKANTLTSVQKDSLLLDLNYHIVRTLTPIEAERLQTLPDNYTEGVSATQRFRCLGNGFTVDVIAHILEHLINPHKFDFQPKQLSLFGTI